MLLLSFGNPALIILFLQRSVVAASCIWLDEDRRGHTGAHSSRCPEMGTEQLVSSVEEVVVRNLGQAAHSE